MRKTIIILGLRACGKTTVGRHLAFKYKLDFVDTDDLCRASAGQSIAALVAEKGWPAFRELESAVLRQLLITSSESFLDNQESDSNTLLVKPLVIATGGGIVLAEANRALIKEAGGGVYIEAEADLLYARLTANPDSEQRPPLSNSPLLEEIRTNLAQRDALYRECAKLVLSARLSVKKLAQRIALEYELK